VWTPEVTITAIPICGDDSVGSNLCSVKNGKLKGRDFFVSAKRTASCERLSDVAMLRHDATYKADMDEVAKADPGARA
jgi:hypothetical protein